MRSCGKLSRRAKERWIVIFSDKIKRIHNDHGRRLNRNFCPSSNVTWKCVDAGNEGKLPRKTTEDFLVMKEWNWESRI